MNHFACAGFAVLLSSVVLNAQQPASKPDASAPVTHQKTQIVLPPVTTCPIGMRARQGSATQVLRADDGSAQPLMTPTLTLTPTDSRVLVAATVTAHGMAPTGAAMDLVAHLVDKEHPAIEPPGIAKTVTIELHASEGKDVSGELDLPGFSAVRTIVLNSVTYADGTTWKLAADSGCRVAPDPLLLISGRWDNLQSRK